MQHHPVLLEEAIAFLAIKPNGIYVDGTFGRGGHSRAILAKLDTVSEESKLYVFDQDPDAITYAHEHFSNESRMVIFHDSFVNMKKTLEPLGLVGKVNGILLDLGVSSIQLDDASRGFSFMHDGPLDMRMDTTRGQSAKDWLQAASVSDISRVLKFYGEELVANKIARAIVAAREVAPIETTKQLADIICSVKPRRPKDKKHPATLSFQAIRLHVNQELEVLTEVLHQAMALLAVGGRLCLISFHSLEDRIVKQFMKQEEKCDKDIPVGLPIQDKDIVRRIKIVAKNVRPSEAEIARNPRSRSAVLRVAERI